MQFPTRLYMDGELVDGEGIVHVHNPATEMLVASVAAAGLNDVEQALQCARKAAPGWAASSIAERQHWMLRLRDAVLEEEEFLRLCIHHEMGKPWGGT